MKLLIVDDEELTRTGVISSLDWKSLGIDEVLQADDGVHGLEAARIHRPEIILCDVRMPRMDGITMLERLEKILPDSVPIFMSGYSDKEYLKAAIKLKAVNYIEKPLVPSEIRDAVLEARNLYMQKLHSHRGETMKSMETASQLALLLTVPYNPDSSSLDERVSELKLTMNPSTYFTSVIVKMDDFVHPETPSFPELFDDLRHFVSRLHMDCIYTEKKRQYLVYFLFGQTAPSSHTIASVGNFLCSHFAPFVKFSIAAGDTVCGVARAYQSYASAVILLQSSFFFPANTMLTSETIEKAASGAALSMPSPEDSFSEALSSGNEDEARVILDHLASVFQNSSRFLQNPVRDLYYRLFLCLESARNQQQISGSKNPESIAETIARCFTFSELHDTLVEKTEAFFRDAANNSQENPTIFLIKKYISQNYMNETLSVKDISAHVFLSASYVCTFFKNETGRTLNQYITEYRMEKAKQLLLDSRYKISDISSRVGYSDGNYFGKSFKKYSGLSPSEYREKNLQ